MAGSIFNPLDLVPNSLRSRQSPKTRASLAATAQHGGRINNNLPPHNLTAYQASFLQSFEELPSPETCSSHLPIPQDDTYQQMLFNEDQQRAIQALSDVPDDLVLQQLALTRSGRSHHSGSSHGLVSIPEAPPYPFINSTQPIDLMSEMPPPAAPRLSHRSSSSHLPGPWDGSPLQHKSYNASSLDTTSSWSNSPSIFTQPGSFEAPTENSSRHPSRDFKSQASVSKANSFASTNEASANTVTRDFAVPSHPECSLATVNEPSNKSISSYAAITDSPELPSKTRTSSASTNYSCTLCESKATFRGKSEWKRHELSHMPSVEYVCLPDGHIQDDRCSICGIYHPDIQHVIEHNAHLCLAKDEAARTWVRKDKFVKHLTSHGLSSNCAQVKRWSRKLPPKLSACGFCIRGFNDSNERCLHVAKHFESGSDRAKWDRSKVILGLLSQPRTALSWQSLLGAAFKGRPSPPISWSEELAPEIQKRLEENKENGHDLALAAYELSSLCQPDQSGANQQLGPAHDPNEDTVHRVEHLLNRNFDPFVSEAPQSWFDDSELVSDSPMFGGPTGPWGL